MNFYPNPDGPAKNKKTFKKWTQCLLIWAGVEQALKSCDIHLSYYPRSSIFFSVCSSTERNIVDMYERLSLPMTLRYTFGGTRN